MSWEELLKRKVSGKRVDHLPNDEYTAIRESILENDTVTVYSQRFADANREMIEAKENSTASYNTIFILPKTNWKIARDIVFPLGMDEGNLDGNMNASSWFSIHRKKLRD